MNNPDEAVPANQLELDLAEVLHNHHFDHIPSAKGQTLSSKVLARHLIRELDNFRETLQEHDDYFSKQSRVGSETSENGNN